jgi:peptidoglycan/LPS O-acetylase OafA/YrhL
MPDLTSPGSGQNGSLPHGADRQPPVRFRELDVLRGFAALTVVFFHYSRHGTRYFDHYPFDFWPGEFGVHLFFTISGFVIYYTLERSRSVVDFAFSRFSRLYPTYWAVLGLLFLWGLLDPHVQLWWPGYVVNATMLQRFVGYPDVDNVYWTLGVELVFYVVIALVFASGQLARVPWVGLGWLLLALAWGSVHEFAGSGEKSIGNTWLILPYAPYFVAGMMFYLLHSRRFSWLCAGNIALAASVVWLIHGPIVAAISIFIFLVVALAVSGWLSFLIMPVTLWFGAISYPLYLVHRLPGYSLLDLMNSRGVAHLAAFAIALLGALIAAQVLHLLIELPVMRWLRAWYYHRGT